MICYPFITQQLSNLSNKLLLKTVITLTFLNNMRFMSLLNKNLPVIQEKFTLDLNKSHIGITIRKEQPCNVCGSGK